MVVLIFLDSIVFVNCHAVAMSSKLLRRIIVSKVREDGLDLSLAMHLCWLLSDCFLY